MADLLWDIRTQMENDEAKIIEGILDKHSNKHSYYIWKYANWTGNDSMVLKATYRLVSKPPLKLLGSVCWLVKNKEGTITKLWDLPHDHNIDPTLFDPDNVVEDVQKSISGMENCVRFG